MVNPEGTAGVAVPEHDQPLPHRSEVVEQRWKTAGRAGLVLGADVKGHQGVRRLPGNRGAEDAVPRNRVARQSVVRHDQRDIGRPGINPVIQGKRLHAVRIMHPGRNDRGLAGGGHGRIVGDLVNRRSGVGDQNTVGQPGRAQIGGNRKGGGGFQPVAVQPQVDLGPSMHPTRLVANGGGVALAQGVRPEGHFTGIYAGPKAVAAPDVQRVGAVGVSRVFQTGAHLIPLQ